MEQLTRETTGPDFTNGFGSMNLLRSVDMLNNGRYFISTINNGGMKHTQYLFLQAQHS
jgi:hypothetical protein